MNLFKSVRQVQYCEQKYKLFGESKTIWVQVPEVRWEEGPILSAVIILYRSKAVRPAGLQIADKNIQMWAGFLQMEAKVLFLSWIALSLSTHRSDHEQKSTVGHTKTAAREAAPLLTGHRKSKRGICFPCQKSEHTVTNRRKNQLSLTPFVLLLKAGSANPYFFKSHRIQMNEKIGH